MNAIKKIFIIDDDSIFVYSLQKLISNAKFAEEIVVFPDAEEAIIFFEENILNEQILPDIVFLDINMPMMTGWEFLEDYDKLYEQTTKLIDLYVVSSSISPTDISKASEYEYVKKYITKPITSQILVEIKELSDRSL